MYIIAFLLIGENMIFDELKQEYKPYDKLISEMKECL